MKTPVRILRGRFKGREGWISGTLEDRAARGVTQALVHVEGELPDLFATSSLAKITQADLFGYGNPVQRRESTTKVPSGSRSSATMLTPR